MSDYNFYSKEQRKKKTVKIALAVVIALSLIAVCLGGLYMYLYNDDGECKSVKYSYNILNPNSSVNDFVKGAKLSVCDGVLKSSGNLFVRNVSKDSDNKAVTISYDAGLNGKSGERVVVLPVNEKIKIDKSTFANDKASSMVLNMNLEVSDKYNEFKSKFCSKFNISFCTVDVVLTDWSLEENNIAITKENIREYKDYLVKYGTEWIIKNVKNTKGHRLYSASSSFYKNISSTLKTIASDDAYAKYVSQFLNSSMRNRIINSVPNGLSVTTCTEIKELINDVKNCGTICEEELDNDFIPKLEEKCNKYDIDSYVSANILKNSFKQISIYADISSTWKAHSNDSEYLRTTAQIINDYLADPSFLLYNLYENSLSYEISEALDVISKNANSCGSTCTNILSSTISSLDKYFVVKKSSESDVDSQLISESNYLRGEELSNAMDEDYSLFWLDGNSLKKLAYLLYNVDNNYTSVEKQSILLYSYYSFINNRYRDFFKYYGAYYVADVAFELYKNTKNPIYLNEYEYIYNNTEAKKFNEEDGKYNGLLGPLAYLNFYNNYNSLNTVISDDMMNLIVKKTNKLLDTINGQPDNYDFASYFADSFLIKIISTL